MQSLLPPRSDFLVRAFSFPPYLGTGGREGDHEEGAVGGHGGCWRSWRRREKERMRTREMEKQLLLLLLRAARRIACSRVFRPRVGAFALRDSCSVSVATTRRVRARCYRTKEERSVPRGRERRKREKERREKGKGEFVARHRFEQNEEKKKQKQKKTPLFLLLLASARPPRKLSQMNVVLARVSTALPCRAAAAPARCCIARDHASPVVAASLLRSQQQHRNRRRRQRRPELAAAVSSSSSSSSSSSFPPPPEERKKATAVEGAVALVLECISLARKADVEG